MLLNKTSRYLINFRHIIRVCPLYTLGYKVYSYTTPSLRVATSGLYCHKCPRQVCYTSIQEDAEGKTFKIKTLRWVCYRKNFIDTFKNHNYVMLPITFLKQALKKAARKWVFLCQTFQNFCHVINNLFWCLDVIEPILQPHYLVILYLSALFSRHTMTSKTCCFR